MQKQSAKNQTNQSQPGERHQQRDKRGENPYWAMHKWVSVILFDSLAR